MTHAALRNPDDARLFLERDMEAPETFPVPGGVASVFSSRSPDKETPNEDAAALIPFGDDAVVLVVADGVGGVRGGEQASRLAVEALWTELAKAAESGAVLRSAILDAIEAANEAVTEMRLGAATTLAALEVQGRTVRPYHVGDSMILVTGQRGRLKLQTVAHSPVGFAVEAGVLDEAQAMHHEDRHLVSNVLGAPDMRIEIGSAIALAPRDTVLLASDGLADNLHTIEIVDQIRVGPIDRAAARIADDARHRMAKASEGRPSKPDDLTFVVYRGANTVARS
ncbi:MAG: serine/threonine-protein phosphatase [Myxococcales bacterium]|nr:serine/threonine-protein phosphatase [Myxococcales bacterium]